MVLKNGRDQSGGGMEERRSYCEFGGVIDGSTTSSTNISRSLSLSRLLTFHTFLKVPVLFDGLGHTDHPQSISF